MATHSADKTVLCWINLGPYHIARASALAAQTNLTVIEYAASQKLYGWSIDRSTLPFEIVTLSEGAWEEQSIPRLARLCWKSLDRIRPNRLIIPGWSNPLALLTAIWGCLRGVPRVVLTESTAVDRPRSGWKESLKGLLINGLYNGASFGGKPQLRYLEQLKFPEANTAPFYNVVDNQFFASSTAQLRRDRRATEFRLPGRYFLYVGRLAPEKNLAALIRGFARYRADGGTFDLVLAGDGPLQADLTSMPQNLDISGHCHFVGSKGVNELPPYYAFAIALVLPSVSEPWGLVVNEAMAAGLPILVSTRCGCAEDLVVEGQNGYLFSPDREEEIADRMARIESHSETKLAAMGQFSRERISQYSPENWAIHLVKLMTSFDPSPR